MNHIIRHFKLSWGQSGQRWVRIALAGLALALFVLGAGAPGAGGCC